MRPICVSLTEDERRLGGQTDRWVGGWRGGRKGGEKGQNRREGRRKDERRGKLIALLSAHVRLTLYLPSTLSSLRDTSGNY